ncbi:hypothetical protein AB0H83_31815 [Dactylosporangium sp. NPDC050688]|uniref:hypothetical protein n=1 Tax=Dactylosporangium sp. NPDC050688 TaxID=3157217 RepID=UPI0033E29AC5
MSQTDAAIAADLILAGLEFVERFTAEVHPPLPPNRSPATCQAEHGRFDSDPDEFVDVDAPDMPAKVNAGWWRMANEFELFDEQREFLLGVDYRDPDAIDPEYAWVRVRLAETWDLAASGSTALRSFLGSHFTRRFVPEFTMLSLDQRMILNTTVWGDATVSTIVIRPDRIT